MTHVDNICMWSSWCFLLFLVKSQTSFPTTQALTTISDKITNIMKIQEKDRACYTAHSWGRLWMTSHQTSRELTICSKSSPCTSQQWSMALSRFKFELPVMLENLYECIQCHVHILGFTCGPAISLHELDFEITTFKMRMEQVKNKR
jgi:hypothetical protein